MLKTPFLRNILIVALFFATILPLFGLLIIRPSYETLIEKEAEEDAVRYVRQLTFVFGLQGIPLRKEEIPVSVRDMAARLQGDGKLTKLRFFSSAGEIILSSLPEEEGAVNTHEYFRERVARGEVFSKVAHKSSATADGAIASVEVVETYVPIMVAGTFRGAVETYYDITEQRKEVERISAISLCLIFTISFVLLLTLLILLRRAWRIFEAHQSSEENLRRANESLEERVSARTRELQEALLASEENRNQIDSILRSVSDGLLVTDQHQRIQLVNAVADQMLAANRQHLVGVSVEEVFRASGISVVLIDALKGRLSTQISYQVPGQDSAHPRYIQARTSPVLGHGGDEAGMIILLRDITHEREVERVKSEFVAMAVHELQTPLTVVLGYAELLSKDGGETNLTSAERREYLSCISEKAEGLSRIVDDLLVVNRMDVGTPLPLEKATFIVDDLVIRTVNHYRQNFTRHEFVTEFTSAAVALYADRGRIGQVLENLLSNAVKYSPQGGTIRVLGRISDGGLTITVKDMGIGMSSDQVLRAFDKFYRVSLSNATVAGTGLGLSIAKHIVESHGGRIWVESVLGQGTSVHFTLPLDGEHP